MIYVSKDQLAQVEYLIQQSSRGNHVLFDAATLRGVFAKRDDLSEEQAYAVEPHLERLIAEPTLEAKRAYLEGLEPKLFGQVVRTYFNIVENSIFEKIVSRH